MRNTLLLFALAFALFAAHTFVSAGEAEIVFRKDLGKAGSITVSRTTSKGKSPDGIEFTHRKLDMKLATAGKVASIWKKDDHEVHIGFVHVPGFSDVVVHDVATNADRLWVLFNNQGNLQVDVVDPKAGTTTSSVELKPQHSNYVATSGKIRLGDEHKRIRLDYRGHRATEIWDVVTDRRGVPTAFKKQVPKKVPKIAIATLFGAAADPDELEAFLKAGHDIDHRNREEGDGSLLMLAARGGHLDMVGLLLEKGADLRLADRSGNTALHWAVKNYHLDVLELLIKRGADVNRPNDSGVTPLHRTVMVFGMKSPQAAKILLEAKADIDKQDANSLTPLMHAVENGNEGAVRFLVEHGADPKATDQDGKTAGERLRQNRVFQSPKGKRIEKVLLGAPTP